jgi:nitrous oxidase accessory protein
VGGGGDAAEVDWQGNYWDDYQGYDLDADGVGDVPYRLRSLAGEMTSRYPDLAFLRGTPTLGLVDAAGHALPIFTPQTLLEDATPLVRPPPAAEDDDAR